MADRIVYVHPSLPSTDAVTITRPAEYDALLEAGWEIVATKNTKVDGKQVEKVHLRRREDNRGVSVRRRPAEDDGEEAPRSRGGALSVLGDQRGPGAGTGVAVARGGASFLGGGSDFAGLPGIAVGSSMLIQHAYSMGADAAHQGLSESDCPWPPGEVGATQWLRGFRAAAKAATTGGDPTGGPTAEAYEAGRAAAKGDDDLEVHCPYPEGTPHYQEWLRGFRDAGGRIE